MELMAPIHANLATFVKPYRAARAIPAPRDPRQCGDMPPLSRPIVPRSLRFDAGAPPPDLSLGQRIASLRHGRGWTQAQLAERLDVGTPTVTRWENGARAPSNDDVVKIAQLFGVKPAWLMGWDVGGPSSVPLLGYIGAGAEVFPVDDHAKGQGLDVVSPPFWVEPDCVALRVRGDSMLPAIPDGAVILYRRDIDFEAAHCLNRLCVVRLGTGALLVKTLRRGREYGRFDLISVNAAPMEDIEIEWAAPVKATLYDL